MSFLARQKGRLAACKQRQVAGMAGRAVDSALQQLAAAGLDPAALLCAPPFWLFPCLKSNLADVGIRVEADDASLKASMCCTGKCGRLARL